MPEESTNNAPIKEIDILDVQGIRNVDGLEGMDMDEIVLSTSLKNRHVRAQERYHISKTKIR